MKQLKYKPCKVCKTQFKPFSSLSRVCSPHCALKLVRSDKEKALKKDTRERKKKLKTKTDYANEAQTVINKYARLRDKGKPCCSCDKPDNGQHQRHASHYRSIGACTALRFNLKNIHTSCQQCNTSKSGNLLEYRIRLIAKHGQGYVDYLESQNQVVRYEVVYLERLKRVFSKRVRLREKRYNYT